MTKPQSYDSMALHKAGTELSRLREEKDILQRNFVH